uniref:Sulfatase N-terminal domain-containing protein n=1 Tax=Acrobeloides nanus TaxID=290746 RepID=A0A914CBD4_9BILA
MSAQVHIGVTLLLLISCFLSSTQCQHRPNILLILVDDLGYNDLDWRDTRLFTPNIRRLAFSENTVQLANSYVNHLCTPTRASLMSGYYPHRTGTEDGVFLQMEMSGVPTDLPFLPQSLKPLGYNTYLIGKWHLGYCKRDFLPTARGFDSFYGYYGPQEGYFNHSASVYNRAIGKHVDGLDLFYEKNGISIPDFTKNGVYSTNLFLQETMRVLDSHPRTNPFFLFLSFQSVHAPLQVPSHYRIHCPFLGHDKKRHIYCAMLAALDEATGQLIAYLKQKQLYENTIIIFTSDNGGDPELGASNFPYRGGKSTIWEGGTKTTTFIHAPSYIQRFAWRNE